MASSVDPVGQRSSSGPSTLSIGDQLRIVIRQWPLVAAVILVCVGGTWFAGRSTEPTYRSTATVTLRTFQNEALFPAVSMSSRERFLRTPAAELEYVRSDVFRSLPDLETVAQVPVRASAVETSNQLVFTATAPDPESAQRAVDVWATAYVESRIALTRSDVESSIAALDTAIADLEAQKAIVLEPLAPIDRAIETAIDPDVLTRLTTQRLTIQQSLEDELRPIENQLFILNDNRSNLLVTEEFLSNDDISAIVSSAGGLGRSTAPSMPRNLGIAAAIGALLAVGMALVRDSLRTRVLDRRDVERSVPGLSILAEVPDHGRRNSRATLAPVSESSAFTEGVESLVTVLGLILRDSRGNRFLFTSPQSSDGKTTLVANVAARLGTQWIQVVAVDADLRRPNLSQVFGAASDADGLSSVLDGRRGVASVLYAPAPGLPLEILPAGPLHQNPAALIRSGHTSTLFEKLGDEADIVLIDSAPCLPVTDSVALAALAADHIILLARSGSTRRDDLRAAAETMAESGTPVAGVVLVGTKRRRGYQSYYVGESTARRRRRR